VLKSLLNKALAYSLTGPAIKYLLVTAINVVNHFVIFFSLLALSNQLDDGVTRWSDIDLYWASLRIQWLPLTDPMANLFAASIASIPAFLLSRYWVWEVKGKASFRRELLPFWALAALGVIVSTLMVRLAKAISEQRLFIVFVILFSYFIVWVMKFLLLNLVFSKSKARQNPAKAMA
jgi:putative flippase GtrA